MEYNSPDAAIRQQLGAIENDEFHLELLDVKHNANYCAPQRNKHCSKSGCGYVQRFIRELHQPRQISLELYGRGVYFHKHLFVHHVERDANLLLHRDSGGKFDGHNDGRLCGQLHFEKNNDLHCPGPSGAESDLAKTKWLLGKNRDTLDGGKRNMTENELRQQVVSTALSWLGMKENTARHLEMLAIYNAQSPLPRGTRMLAHWPWCAAFVSVVSLQCGLRDIMPTECGCPGMVRLYQELGRWVEDDAYVPSPGDVVFYNWQDGTNYAVTDNVGQSNHVGIVLSCDGETMEIIEGNNANAVNKRNLAVNGRYIRGFGIPDYASKADGGNPSGGSAATSPDEGRQEDSAQPETPAEETADPFITQIANQVINGKWGNGQARKDALAAWFVKAVQDEVNRILGV